MATVVVDLLGGLEDVRALLVLEARVLDILLAPHGALLARPALLWGAAGRTAPVRCAADLSGAVAASPCTRWVQAHAGPLSIALGAVIGPSLFFQWRSWQKTKAWRRKGVRGRARSLR